MAIIESYEYDIIARLKDRFSLAEGALPGKVLLDSEILIVSQVDELLKVYGVGLLGTCSRLAASGAGYVVAHTVPEGYRDTIYALSLDSTGGDGTIQYLYAVDASGTYRVWLATQAVPAVNYWVGQLTHPLTLNQRELLHIYINAITTDSAWQTRAIYAREKAY